LKMCSPSETRDLILKRSVDSRGEKYAVPTFTLNKRPLSLYSVSYFSSPAMKVTCRVLYSPLTFESCFNTVLTLFIFRRISSPIICSLEESPGGILMIAISPITSNEEDSDAISRSLKRSRSASFSLGNYKSTTLTWQGFLHLPELESFQHSNTSCRPFASCQVCCRVC